MIVSVDVGYGFTKAVAERAARELFQHGGPSAEDSARPLV